MRSFFAINDHILTFFSLGNKFQVITHQYSVKLDAESNEPIFVALRSAEKKFLAIL